MTIPTFLRQKIVDKEGLPTSPMQQYFDDFNIWAQKNVSDDGFAIPPRTTTDINAIADPSNENSMPNGTMWYDETTDQFKGKIAGVVKVFTLT